MNIKSRIKRLIDNTQYVAVLEKQNALLKANLQKEKAQKCADEETQYQKRSRNYLRPIKDMQEWLLQNYDFRYNVITDVFEYRKKSGSKTEAKSTEGYEVIDKYAINSIAIEIQEAGIFVKDHFVERLIKSKYAKHYHPVRSYINKVKGTWDGKERISDFLSRINQTDYCQKMGRIWLRAMVAQMAGIDENHANSVMLTLVSAKQGLHKSTFLRNLLPMELRDYYTDDFSLNQKGNAQRKIVEFAIINDDELDKEDAKKMPLMKTLMQTMKPSFIGSYKKNFNRLPRSASFTGTSNQLELLTDRTGSRRFLILEPEGMINVEGIEHDQIYAQLLAEIQQGAPYFFSKEDEQEIQLHNQPYYVKTPLEKIICNYYRKAANEEEKLLLSASNLLEQLRQKGIKELKQVAGNTFSKALTRLFGAPIHTKLGNVYALAKV